MLLDSEDHKVRKKSFWGSQLFNENHHSTRGPILSPKEKKEKKGKHRVKGQKTRVKKIFSWTTRGHQKFFRTSGPSEPKKNFWTS
jgi:hypothetical protein